MSERCKWKKREDNLILKHYKYNFDHLVVLLKSRTVMAIMIRASRLGVSSRPWLAVEDEVIVKCYPDYGAAYCMRYLKGRTFIAIQNRAIKLKVKRDLTKRHNSLPKHNVIEMEKMMFNKRWGEGDD